MRSLGCNGRVYDTDTSKRKKEEDYQWIHQKVRKKEVEKDDRSI
jgi:hypothetical protein